VSKLAGLGGIICGVLDLVNPSLIPGIKHPAYALGAGIALLTGKSIVSMLYKAWE
jgi:hypothetical protein